MSTEDRAACKSALTQQNDEGSPGIVVVLHENPTRDHRDGEHSNIGPSIILQCVEEWFRGGNGTADSDSSPFACP